MVSLQLKRSLDQVLLFDFDLTVADLHSKILDVRPPRPNSINFMQFLGIFLQNRMLAPPPPRKVVAPISGETLDPPLFDLILFSNSMNSLTTYCGKIYFCGHIVKKNKVSDFKEEMSFLRITQNWQC